MNKDMQQYLDKAEVLIEALPYIQRFNRKIVVVKYGGNAMTSGELKRSVMEDLLLLHLVGVKVILVHGGGPAINQTLAAMQIPSSFKNGLRVTDRLTMDVVQMVLAGKVNKDLAALLTELGGKAVGLCGIDGAMIRVRQQDESLGFVGKIEHIDTALIDAVLDSGYIPVISSVGIDDTGQAYNINADTVAAQLAGALQAETMVAMTNVDGVLADPNDPASLIPVLTAEKARELEKNGVIAGGMLPKVACCLEAIEAGAKKVFIINGEVPHALLIELLTDEGLGTMFIQ